MTYTARQRRERRGLIRTTVAVAAWVAVAVGVAGVVLVSGGTSLDVPVIGSEDRASDRTGVADLGAARDDAAHGGMHHAASDVGAAGGSSDAASEGAPGASTDPDARGADSDPDAAAPASRDGQSGLLPGMPEPLSPTDVYAADRPNALSALSKRFRQLVYVPNSESSSVDVIDPVTHRIVRNIPVGTEPQHVVPSWDLKTLWVTSDRSNTLTAIDPRTGRAGRTIPVDDPYNLYFTPDGKRAVVVAERNQRLDFRDPHTMALKRQVHVRCRGIDHIDFSANGRFMLASCEFSGKLAVFEVAHERLIGTIALPGVDGSRMRPMHGSTGRLVRVGTGGGGPDGSGMPQDVKLSPDGHTFYIADMQSNGVWSVDARTWRVRSFLHTGAGTHGLYVSRDSHVVYVTNRGEGSVTLIGANDGRIRRTWRIPGGGSPDMGGISADGTVLWLSGRYHSEVYGMSTRTGRVVARVRVGSSPHGLAVYPQPGRYSLGHTGIMR